MRIAGLIIGSVYFSEDVPISGYFANRLNDGADIITLSVGAGSRGKISVGPIYINTFGVMHRDLVGLRYGDFVSSPSVPKIPKSAPGSDGRILSYSHRTTETAEHSKPEFFFTDIPFLMTRKRARSWIL